MLAVALAPGLAAAAAGQPAHHRGTQKPVSVYIGRQLVATGLSVSSAIGKVQAKVAFTIRTPRYTPSGYAAAQLAVTPTQRDISRGWSTLTYLRPQRGSAAASNDGFVIDQSPSAIPVVGGTRVASVVANGLTATLHEFKTAGQDIMILTWVDAAGNGYDIVTDAAHSHLSPATLGRIAASLH